MLYALLEQLSGESLRSLGKMSKGKMRIQVSVGCVGGVDGMRVRLLR